MVFSKPYSSRFIIAKPLIDLILHKSPTERDATSWRNQWDLDGTNRTNLGARLFPSLGIELISSFVIRHSSFYLASLLLFRAAVPEAAPTVSPPTSDITFTCAHCSSALVVDAAAAGMTLECQRCGKPTPVPAIAPRDTQSAQAQAQLADLERQLKENESQRTEITGYINQLSIQLHRWQLRLQTLNERRQQLEKEVRAAKLL